MQPADPDFAARTRASFASQGAMGTLGAELLEVAPGRVVIGFANRPALGQQHGFVHAGMLSAALDSAAGYAAGTLMPADAEVLTIEFKVNLLAPAAGPWLRCEAEVLKPGRTICVSEATAWQSDPARPDEPPRRVATLTATLMLVRGRTLPSA